MPKPCDESAWKQSVIVSAHLPSDHCFSVVDSSFRPVRVHRSRALTPPLSIAVLFTCCLFLALSSTDANVTNLDQFLVYTTPLVLTQYSFKITMEDWNGFMSKRSNFGGRSMKDDDFEEDDDLWGIEKESEDSCPRKMRKSRDYYPCGSSWHNSSAQRMIPKANNTSTTPTPHEAKMLIQQSSAPMDIPDWSKIYKKNTNQYYNSVGVNDDEDDNDDMVPPHEWIARNLARTQISSSSVYEGIGRRLKGRDLSKVRNAILTKTGFLE